MAETPRLDLPYIAASQYQKEVVHNQSLDRLDLLCQCAVLDRNLSTPPASPALGDAYIVGPSPTGAWSGHANELALWVSSQWELIAPLPGFQCWVIDEAVLVYWNGTAWTLVTTGGGGATTFLALTDTPDTYVGQSGKAVVVNATENGVEFGTTGGGAPPDATYITATSNATLSAERVLTDNSTITWDLATAGQVKALIAPDAVSFAQMQPVAEGTLVGRSTPSIGDIESITVGSGLTLAGGILNIAGGAVTSFLALTDTPDTYTGQGGKAVVVNAGATGLEFGTAGSATASQGAEVERMATTQSIAQNMNVAVIFDTEVRDDNNFWASGQPTRLTAPTAGWYTITAFIQWDATASQTRIVNLRINGTNYIAVTSESAAGVDQRQSLGMNWYLSAGDYIEVILFQTTAATRAITARASIVGMTAAPLAATTFLALTDTPDVYTGNALKILRANAAATATEFGPVLGTMAEQNSNAVAITGGTASLGGHAPTGVLDVQSSVQASDIANAYFGLRVWPKAPAGALNTQPIRIHPSTESQAAAAFRGVLVSDQPTGWSFCSAFEGSMSAGTGRYNLYVSGTAPNHFAGNVGIGDLPSGTVLRVRYDRAASNGAIIVPTADSGSGAAIQFAAAGLGIVGSITTTASATAFNTSSDVRLKHSIAPLTDALTRVRALRPVAFRWNADDSPGVGFLAHELQQVVPEAVTGEPDAVNDDGSVRPQGVDHSRLVPWLTAGLQEAVAQIQTLTARISALEEALGL